MKIQQCFLKLQQNMSGMFLFETQCIVDFLCSMMCRDRCVLVTGQCVSENV